MKKVFLLITVCLIASVQSGSFDKCKAVGWDAEQIMNYRQNKDDLFATLDKYDNKEIVIAAFERPRHDLIGSLTELIDANSALQRQIAMARHDEVKGRIKNEVSLFKMKYIKLCLASN